MRYSAALLTGAVVAHKLRKEEKPAECWIFRDDIGAYWGIKGYEEMVTEVGGDGIMKWPQDGLFGNYNGGSVRRGWQVFSKNCANCHSMLYRQYDFLMDRGYKQLELAAQVANFSINPAHHHYKQYYYQEWKDRDRVLTDHMYSPYYSIDQAKTANNGVWPVDLSKIRLRPGGINYVYNILTGYHFTPPHGLDVPKGKHFNPYFDHMIIGMARQLHDGMIDYDDGTPASTPQMAYDVSNFLTYMQIRVGGKMPDRLFRLDLMMFAFVVLLPIRYLVGRAMQRNFLSFRLEAYAVRDGVYYKHFRTGQRYWNPNMHWGRVFYW